MRFEKFILPVLFLFSSPLVALAQEDGLAKYGAYQSKPFAGGVFISAICDLYSLIGGSLGGMLTSAAIFTALIAAAGGGFNSARSAMIVAVGSFGFSAGVSLYFGTFACS